MYFHFQLLERFPEVKTLVLKIPEAKVKTLVGDSVYRWAGSNCKLIDREFYVQNIDEHRIYNFTCEQYRKQTLKPIGYGAHLLSGTALQKRDNGVNETLPITFIHILSNAMINMNGDITTTKLRIIPQRCTMKRGVLRDPVQRDIDDIPLYNEVFIISQLWNGYFHAVVEQLSKISPYICFLRNHPGIKIHMNLRPDMINVIKDYFEFLKLNSSRLVMGPVRARVAYAPAGNPCSHSGLFITRLLSLWLRHHIKTAADQRTSVVIIKRKKGWRRWFNYHDSIKQKLQDIVKRENKLVIEELSDPVPPLHYVSQMFNRAAMIVAPHGAGLANMLFSEPGTIVVEGMCRVFYTALCFRNLAYTLGHRYYGFLKEDSCLNYTAKDFERPMEFYVNLVNQSKARRKRIAVHHLKPSQGVHNKI